MRASGSKISGRDERVTVEPKQSKLTVIGYVDLKKVLHRVRYCTGQVADFWPYTTYDLVDHPYAPGAYDKKASPWYVWNVIQDPQAFTRPC
ncbi:hypothetical protein CRG98_011417 [Punica granatum]|uniref:Uncharacterized protein n=1 Tax=Punica granatum TaxID=22663 RepID=A0A2I0KIA1_PUNGR|nr:hypothetical protein CRG98_011417 [Punica granatum]